MNKFSYISAKALSLAAGVMMMASLSLVSCKSEKKTDDIIVDKIVEKPQTGPQRMSNDETNGSVTWISGAEYSYTILRQASDSLDVIENHEKKYYDNTVKLVVRRADGTVFFQKKFSKTNFSNVLPENVSKSGVLLGMKFVEAVGNELHFVVGVGSPDETYEEFYYVQMTLDNFGGTRAEEFKEKAEKATE